ncbi:CBS domain-containing protein [Candidatus Woesearchaeota archaeon]|nr:CBS domain-containing protein [Candidatus Woesearchaeota archaeon]
MKTGIKVIDAMTTSPVFAKASDSVHSCVQKMIKENVGSLIVADGRKLIGIITEKDLLTKALGNEINIKTARAESVMTKNPVFASPELDLYDAMILMKNEEIRRLPIVRNGNVVGLLTYKDILSIQPDLYEIRIEGFKIRENDRKSKLRGSFEGNCYSCSSYGPLTKIGRKWLCDSCKE